MLTDYMKEEERFRDPKFSTSALEKELGVKKYALNLAFQEVTGLSISDTLQQMRLEYARNLVENTDDILEVVATKSGFGSDRTFYRLFRQAYGITPTAYRKMHRIVEDDNN
jgi:AraC-like DNA-binding protein